ncbi:hypothetical protein CY0110_17097 [Crocosphaera chwakensis CCY0110]|uniref:Uncharacterized protein n=1 Tax=Crocosphaera chwakensis CCY0110 TaxID=391612 RepID=A3IIA1_9CHRO|nr:hypothetical protein CY0110_17097 [Crocosphaera chwakensis CCY0110]
MDDDSSCVWNPSFSQSRWRSNRQ